MTQAELDASTAAVRAFVNKTAGWYASYITDDMCRGAAAAAITAYAKIHVPPTTAVDKAELEIGQGELDELTHTIEGQVKQLQSGS